MDLARRTFVFGAAAAASAQGEPFDIVDTHIHIYDPTRPEGVPWPPKSDELLYKPHLARDFYDGVRNTPVRKAVIIEASPWPADNDWIVARAKADPAFVCVVGNFSGVKELERFSKVRQFRGIRIGAQLLDKIEELKRVGDAGLSVDVLTPPSEFDRIADTATRIPNTRFIVDHLPLYPNPIPALKLLREAPNVWIKVSAVDPGGANNKELLDQLWDIFGAHRLVYGSNWPVSNKKGTYDQQFQILQGYFKNKSRGERKAFFHDNAADVYRWNA